MKRSRLGEDENIEDNIIKDVRNLFRLKKTKKKTNKTTIKDIRNLFEHGNIRNLFRLRKKVIN